MAKGRDYGTEATEYVDPVTGAEITQLTTNPTHSQNLYFEDCHFTPNSEIVIFTSRRSASRGARSDLFRCNVDGTHLTQLTESDRFSNAVLALDGEHSFFSAGKEIRSVSMDDSSEEVVFASDEMSFGRISVGGSYIFIQATFSKDKSGIVRIDLDGSNPKTIKEGIRIGHLNPSPTGNYVAYIETAETNEFAGQTWYVMDADGEGDHRWPVQNWAHSAWVGTSDRMQGTLLPPDHAITWIAPDQTLEEMETITSGPYFWHSSASADGQWLVADTQWPDIGLQLIHLPTGRYHTLCRSESSIMGHAHPHPSFSPDGTRVLFNSDRTGIIQVYVVKVPEWLTEKLEAGALLKRDRMVSKTV